MRASIWLVVSFFCGKPAQRILATAEVNKGNDSETVTNQGSPLARPAADWVQGDIGRAFELRRDYYKYTIGVATALLAFTTSFPPKLTSVEAPDAVIRYAWPALGIAIICGISVHYLWAWFFITFRDCDNRGAVEK